MEAIGLGLLLIGLVGLVALIGYLAYDKATEKRRRRAAAAGRKTSTLPGDGDEYLRQTGLAPLDDDDSEWQDSDLYATKEGKDRKLRFIDKVAKKKADEGKYESWDDY